MISNTVRRHLRDTAATFVCDEHGGATIWNLTWLMGFAIMAGVAIDTSNARRHETMMVSTADAAALAGLMELPAPNYGIPYNHGSYGDTIEKAALDFAALNMSSEVHGSYIGNSDIYVGHWDFEDREFTWGGAPVNAVHVRVSRGEERGNGLGTTLLRLAGLDNWTINATATAAMPLAECFHNGIVAAGTVKVSANAEIFDGCIHGQIGVEVQPNAIWWEHTGASTGPNGEFKIQPGQVDPYGNPTDPETVRQPLMPSRMAQDVEGVARALLDLNDLASHTYDPEYVNMRNETLQDPNDPVLVITETTLTGTAPADPDTADIDDGVEVASLGGTLPGAAKGGTTVGAGAARLSDMVSQFDATTSVGSTLEEFRTYYAPCAAGNKLTLNGDFRNVVMVSECRIEIHSHSTFENVMMVTLDRTPPFAINAGTDVEFGADDNCAGGGGVRIWADGDVVTAADTTWREVQIYVNGDLSLAGQTGASSGISAHVMGDVQIAANAEIAGLADEVEHVPEDEGGTACIGVGFDWITSDYLWVLVE